MPRTKKIKSADASAGLEAAKLAADHGARHAVPRRPTRKPGFTRYNLLLDATEALLCEHSAEQVGHYQIAMRAGVRPGSVYHFFPTKGAAFLGLAERYIEGFRQLRQIPMRARHIRSWHDVLRMELERAATYYNDHPPAMRIFYAAAPQPEIHEADISSLSSLSNIYYDELNTIFTMPTIRDSAEIFRICFAILDTIWAISFRTEGHISEKYVKMALDACISYCRLFLPDRLDFQDSFLALVEADASIQLFSEGGGEVVNQL